MLLIKNEKMNFQLKRIKVKIFVLTSVFVLSKSSALAQTNLKNAKICETINYDTLTANFIAEVNSSPKFYTQSGTILQDNLIFIDRNIDKTTTKKLYQSDTVILKFLTNGNTVYFNKDSCLNLKKLAEFTTAIEAFWLKKKDKKKYRKSILIDTNNVRYLRITAKLIVINAGRMEMLCPGIYCTDCNDSGLYLRAREKYFENTLVIADVLSFNFRSSK
jgi:hypothetical protein